MVVYAMSKAYPIYCKKTKTKDKQKKGKVWNKNKQTKVHERSWKKMFLKVQKKKKKEKKVQIF